MLGMPGYSGYSYYSSYTNSVANVSYLFSAGSSANLPMILAAVASREGERAHLGLQHQNSFGDFKTWEPLMAGGASRCRSTSGIMA